MKKSFLSILLVLALLLLVLPFAQAEQETEVSLSDTLQAFTPPPMAAGIDSQMITDNAALESLPEQPVQKSETPSADGSVDIIITAVGDLTIGGDARKSGLSIFEKENEKQGGDPSFVMRNVAELFARDHMTLANFEGTLTTAPIPGNKKGNSFLFSAPPEYVKILQAGSIEAVSFENNHVMDHGEEGFRETAAEFDEAGVVWSSENHVGVFEAEGITIGLLSYQTFNGRYPDLFDKVPGQVQQAKAQYDIVIVSFHWGDELDYKPNTNQQKLGRLTIDAGADLVIGHHSHRINPIEKYKDRYIAYSLGNFSFAGNAKPSDMSTFFLQVKFNVKEETTSTVGFRIIPARISSKSDYNDFAPMPFTEQRLIDNVVNCLLSNGKGLEYAVEAYPLDWE